VAQFGTKDEAYRLESELLTDVSGFPRIISIEVEREDHGHRQHHLLDRRHRGASRR
jgi:hypothetical protein